MSIALQYDAVCSSLIAHLWLSSTFQRLKILLMSAIQEFMEKYLADQVHARHHVVQWLDAEIANRLHSLGQQVVLLKLQNALSLFSMTTSSVYASVC